MEKEWKAPVLEVLDVGMTMKGWHDGGSGGDKDKPQEPGTPPDLDS